MRTLIAPVAAMTLLAAVSVASAATVTGTIKSIDSQKDRLTLQNGETYAVPPTMKVSNFKVGEKVKLIYSVSRDKKSKSMMEVSSITPAA